MINQNNNMEQVIAKAQTLIEALPYIQKFNGKKVVVKYGGSAMLDEELKYNVIKDVANGLRRSEKSRNSSTV